MGTYASSQILIATWTVAGLIGSLFLIPTRWRRLRGLAFIGMFLKLAATTMALGPVTIVLVLMTHW